MFTGGHPYLKPVKLNWPVIQEDKPQMRRHQWLESSCSHTFDGLGFFRLQTPSWKTLHKLLILRRKIEYFLSCSNLPTAMNVPEVPVCWKSCYALPVRSDPLPALWLLISSSLDMDLITWAASLHIPTRWLAFLSLKLFDDMYILYSMDVGID